jgi:thioester reductase-like protein
VNHRSKRIADLLPGEKRGLLARLLQKWGGDSMWFLDRLGTTVMDLQAEARLDPTIRPETAPGEPVTEPASIFLTGATGFLGAFLLHELLQQTRADIYCLVRSANAEEGKQRLHRTLESYALWDESLSPRIMPIVGDLSEPFFGLSARQFQMLAHTIESIYHSGALVNWIASYARLKPTNVLGTQEVLRLASQNKTKAVHYISTIAVFPVLANAKVRVIREQDSLDHGGVLYGGYSQSKWVAEKLVTMAQSRGIPVCIYRPALITGHSQTGIWNTDDFLCRAIKSSIELGGAPDMEAKLNIVPVDYVSKAVVHLSKQDNALGRVFHLAHPRPVSWRDLFFAWIKSFGYPVQPLPYDKWRGQLLERGRLQDSAAYFLLPLFSMSLSQAGPRILRNIPEFDCQNTLDGLAGTSIACPPVDSQAFETYFSYFMRCGFLKAPPAGGMLQGAPHAPAAFGPMRTN